MAEGRECFRSRAATCPGSPTARCAVCGMKSRTSRLRRSLQGNADPSARARMNRSDSEVDVGRFRQGVQDSAIRLRGRAEIAREQRHRFPIHGKSNHRGRRRDRPSPRSRQSHSGGRRRAAESPLTVLRGHPLASRAASVRAPTRAGTVNRALFCWSAPRDGFLRHVQA